MAAVVPGRKLRCGDATWHDGSPARSRGAGTGSTGMAASGEVTVAELTSRELSAQVHKRGAGVNSIRAAHGAR